MKNIAFLDLEKCEKILKTTLNLVKISLKNLLDTLLFNLLLRLKMEKPFSNQIKKILLYDFSMTGLPFLHPLIFIILNSYPFEHLYKFSIISMLIIEFILCYFFIIIIVVDIHSFLCFHFECPLKLKLIEIVVRSFRSWIFVKHTLRSYLRRNFCSFFFRKFGPLSKLNSAKHK